MKLLLVISFIAVSYAAKLDRTYLPPPNADTAGGSPGTLTAPNSDAAIPSISQYSSRPENQRRPAFGQTPASPGLNGFNNPNIGPANSDFTGSNDVTSPGGSFGQTPSRTQNFGFNQATGSPQDSSTNTQGSNNFQQSYSPQRAQAAGDINAEILRSANENDGETFSYSFETSNGITAEESGVATDGVRAQGAFSYTGDDGNGYSITYTADENGYLPQGEHLPTPHPIPEEILRSIEENARAAAAGTQEGAYRPEEYENENVVQQYNQDSSSNQAQGQDGSSSPGQAPYSYNRPSVQSSGQQGFSSQTRPGSVNSQQPGFQTQQGQNQSPFGTTGFGSDNNGLANEAGNTNARLRNNQENLGYDYNRPQPNQLSNTNSFGQQPFKQTGFPSTLSSQTNTNQRPIFNTGSSGTFSQSNRQYLAPNIVNSSPNQISQSKNQYNQAGQNKGSDGYNYDRSQSAQYTPTTNSFKQGSFGQAQPQASQGQNNLPLRPNTQTFDNQRPTLNNGPFTGSGTPTSQISNNQQSFGSNKPISKIGPSNNQIGQDNGYNYDKPEFNQFAKPNVNFANQGSFSPQPVQSQTGTPSRSEGPTFGIQRPSFQTGAKPNSQSTPTSQFPINKNQQSFEPIASNQAGQQPSGYNYDRPQANQFSPTTNTFDQMRPQLTRNQDNSQLGPDKKSNDYQRPSNSNFGTTGVGPSSSSNTNQQFGPSRPTGTQQQPGQISGSNASGPQDVSQYMPQKFGTTGPSTQNQAVVRDSTASQAPYKYDRPSSSSITNSRPSFSQGSENLNSGVDQGVRGNGENFGGSRQPPSYSPEEGYKY